ncbi:MAG: hypothetical protein ACSLEX_04460 [Minisyncoccota bacterium]
MQTKILYKIPCPYDLATIEVYGDPENAIYEWRIISPDGRIFQDTYPDSDHPEQGQQYGNPEIALRDALIFSTQLCEA